MTTEVRERKFEEAIEKALVSEGRRGAGKIAEKSVSADKAAAALGGYHKRLSREVGRSAACSMCSAPESRRAAVISISPISGRPAG